MQLTIEQLEAEIARITAELDADDRPCRPGPDHTGETVTRPIFQVGTDPHRTTAKQVGTSLELPEASGIRSHRSSLKLRRRALRRELEERRLEAEAETQPRAGEVLDQERTELLAQLDALKARLKQNAREADRLAVKAELEGMSPARKAALRQVLGPAGVASSSKVGAPQ